MLRIMTPRLFSGRAVLSGSAIDTDIFPLEASANGRYLITQQGDPFFVHGDTPWCLPTQLTREEAVTYLDDRVARGFNSIIIQATENFFSDDPPNNAYGEGPFTTPNDYATPNEDYFSHLDYILQQAKNRNILVLLLPSYMGFNGGSEGWYSQMVTNGATKMRNYGTYLGTRYQQFNNIVWVHGGDYGPPEEILFRSIMSGIRDVDSKWLHSYHADRINGVSSQGGLEYVGPGEPWLTLNTIYSENTFMVADSFAEYNRAAIPAIMFEGFYEGEHSMTPLLIRDQAYKSCLSGACGHFYGNNPVWFFGVGWENALDDAGGVSLIHIKNLFNSLKWWLLVPDQSNTVLTAGQNSGANRAPCAIASDDSFVLVYTPSDRDLTIDMTELSGPNVRARWYDPTNGAYSDVAGTPFPNTGSRVFNPTGNNNAGDADWVLLLESIP